MAVRDWREIEDLLDAIRERVTRANREDRLDQLLASMGMLDLIESQPQPGTKDGKIVVLGSSRVKEKHLLKIAEELGIDKNRFEFCLDYDSIQRYEFSKLKFPDKYSLILVGPMPHSTTGTADSSSAIAEMENRQDLYPRIVRLHAGRKLKITEHGFQKVLESMLQNNYI